MADPKARTGFAPVVLAGLATAVLTSVASAKPWFRASVDDKLLAGVAGADRAADMPLALALALVVLAGWGAMLVTRARARRAVAGLALAAAVGVVACVVAAPFTLPDQVRANLPEGTGAASVSPTGWFVAVAVAAVLSVGVLVLAWVRLPRWPTMSSRYDAPTAGSTGPHEGDLWKALDEGRDPTEAESPPSP
jgi:hypothetical protein